MDIVSHLNDRLLFAVPKKGRLYQQCVDLLKGADIKFNRSNRLDIALCTNLPIALVFLPAADIPRFVGEGRVSLGITGQDQVAEAGISVDEVCNLGFGSCKLQVEVPDQGQFTDPRQLIGKSIVTSFTNLATDYFRKLEAEETNGVGADEQTQSSKPLKTTIKYVGGSVEASCALGIADAVVDLVESGETMRAAGLKAIATIFETSAVLIASQHPTHKDLLELIVNRIKGVIAAGKYVLCNYNCPRSKLDSVLKITPGRRAPTISPLEEDDWVAVSSMVEKKRIAEVMDQLRNKGAEDILVFSISNCRV
ncbi:ATP phosphoribosyltransferase [Myxozyma melibiosi]|uniref:ATP phosphoribosyltransferase n=1 Tax=Myxozyma melibiosi TaxID=54550 RepID=A0ABR1F387_9ASCO